MTMNRDSWIPEMFVKASLFDSFLIICEAKQMPCFQAMFSGISVFTQTDVKPPNRNGQEMLLSTVAFTVSHALLQAHHPRAQALSLAHHDMVPQVWGVTEMIIHSWSEGPGEESRVPAQTPVGGKKPDGGGGFSKIHLDLGVEKNQVDTFRTFMWAESIW